MSRDYTNVVQLAKGTVTTPSGGASGTVIDNIFGAEAFYLSAIQVCTKTAGAQAASEFRVRKKGTTTAIASITVGTTAADNVLSARPADADALLLADTVYELVAITTDASIVYYYEVYGTIPYE
jgi:hypothetical protein